MTVETAFSSQYGITKDLRCLACKCSSESDKMANFDERLCLQWNNFRENISSAFGYLREDKEFTDVTLACEDGELYEAHKVVPDSAHPSYKSKQALSSINLGWGICSSAEKKQPHTQSLLSTPGSSSICSQGPLYSLSGHGKYY